MYKSPRADAEALFTSRQKQHNQVQKEKDKARQDRIEQMARLKAKRLSQDAAQEQPGQAPQLETPAAPRREDAEPEKKPASDPRDGSDLLEIPPHLRRPSR
jgi:hypothetical protein